MDGKHVSDIGQEIISDKSAGSEIKYRFLGRINRAEVGHADATEEEYYEDFLKYIVKKFPRDVNSVYFALCVPSVTTFAAFFIYNNSDINDQGLPRYSAGQCIVPAGPMRPFGTANYRYYYYNILPT